MSHQSSHRATPLAAPSGISRPASRPGSVHSAMGLSVPPAHVSVAAVAQLSASPFPDGSRDPTPLPGEPTEARVPHLDPPEHNPTPRQSLQPTPSARPGSANGGTRSGSASHVTRLSTPVQLQHQPTPLGAGAPQPRFHRDASPVVVVEHPPSSSSPIALRDPTPRSSHPPALGHTQLLPALPIGASCTAPSELMPAEAIPPQPTPSAGGRTPTPIAAAANPSWRGTPTGEADAAPDPAGHASVVAAWTPTVPTGQRTPTLPVHPTVNSNDGGACTPPASVRAQIHEPRLRGDSLPSSGAAAPGCDDRASRTSPEAGVVSQPRSWASLPIGLDRQSGRSLLTGSRRGPFGSLDTGGGSAAAVVGINRAVKREVVETKLGQFYRQHCPAKALNIHEIYEAYENHLPDLFRQLLDKYPKAPPDTFDDVLAIIAPKPTPTAPSTSSPTESAAFGAIGNCGTSFSRGTSEAGCPRALSAAGSMVLGRSPLPHDLAAARSQQGVGPTFEPHAGSQHQPSALKSSASQSARRPKSENATVNFDFTGAGGGRGAGTVAALLAQGQALLESSPSVPDSRTAVASRQQALGYRRQLDSLDHLVEENLKLAQQVADAELAVLHARFRVMLEACLDSDRYSNKVAPGDRLVIECDGRRFNVPLSEAHFRYMLEGPCRAPLPAATSAAKLAKISVVGLAAAQAFGVAQIDANILAAAMREWARHTPHTVTEESFNQASSPASSPYSGARRGLLSRGSTDLRFHTSSTLWWAWPSPVARVDEVQAVSLFADASDGTDAAIAAALQEQLRTDPVASATLDALGLTPNTPLTSLPGFWTHLLNHWEALRRDA
jgi:hypothetical protein